MKVRGKWRRRYKVGLRERESKRKRDRNEDREGEKQNEEEISMEVRRGGKGRNLKLGKLQESLEEKN